MKTDHLYSILCWSILTFLVSCTNNNEGEVDLLISSPESITLEGETYLLNGFLLDNEGSINGFAELVKENETRIEASVEIVNIFILEGTQVYRSSAVIAMNPTDFFTLMSRAEQLPDWVLEAPIQMVIEVRVGSDTFLLRDAEVEQ
ncbi:MAG: hypothetical protein ACFB0B_23040 [Thermonemataceae bacterium]